MKYTHRYNVAAYVCSTSKCTLLQTLIYLLIDTFFTFCTIFFTTNINRATPIVRGACTDGQKSNFNPFSVYRVLLKPLYAPYLSQTQEKSYPNSAALFPTVLPKSKPRVQRFSRFLTLLGPQCRFGDKLLIVKVFCPQIWECGSKRVKWVKQKIKNCKKAYLVDKLVCLCFFIRWY